MTPPSPLPSREAIEGTGSFAATLTLTEIGLGSVLHAFHIPLAGQVMSLNQMALLTLAIKSQAQNASPNASLPFEISNVAAVLKSLSPAGKKLTPMLAISVQGLFFSIGTWTLGPGFAGCLLGGLLSAPWAFLQPAVLYYLLYGNNLLVMGEVVLKKFQEASGVDPEKLLLYLCLGILLKVVLSGVSVVVAWRAPDHLSQKWRERLANLGRSKAMRTFAKRKENPRGRDHLWGALRDLFNPLFIFSLLATATFFWFAEASNSTLIWALMRPIAVGFVLFWLARAVPWARLFEKTRLGKAVAQALRGLR